jgi:hypothetical protein
VTTASRFVQRRRQNLRAALKYAGWLVLVSGLLIACSVVPLHLEWWDAAWPAAIGGAIAALILFAVIVNTPLEAIAYVALYIDRDPYSLPQPSRGFGRALYRESGRLDAMAREAGMTPLSEFESADPLDTHELPAWHTPDVALPTVEYLLARLDPALPLHRHIEYLRDALRAARDREAKFYFLVKTWAGGTNARVEALRHGDLSVLSEGAKAVRQAK